MLRKKIVGAVWKGKLNYFIHNCVCPDDVVCVGPQSCKGGRRIWFNLLQKRRIKRNVYMWHETARFKNTQITFPPLSLLAWWPDKLVWSVSPITEEAYWLGHPLLSLDVIIKSSVLLFEQNSFYDKCHFYPLCNKFMHSPLKYST